MRHFASSACALVIAACVGAGGAHAAPKAKVPSALPEGGNAAIYRIVGEETNHTARVVAVNVTHRVDEAEIGRIADAVRAKETATFERTIVNLYLPGMPRGGGAWAVAAYQPALRITVFGIRAEEEEAALVDARADRRQLIGVWLTAPPASAGRLTIFMSDGQVFSEWKLRAGATSIEPLIESKDRHGRRFAPIAGGTEYVVNGHGDLELRDGGSIIALAERLRGFEPPSLKPEVKISRPMPQGAAAKTRRPAPAGVPASDDSAALSRSVFKM